MNQHKPIQILPTATMNIMEKSHILLITFFQLVDFGEKREGRKDTDTHDRI